MLPFGPYKSEKKANKQKNKKTKQKKNRRYPVMLTSRVDSSRRIFLTYCTASAGVYFRLYHSCRKFLNIK